jgi:hypothetical protein
MLDEQMRDDFSEREQRRREYEESFSYDGYEVVRKELFAHLRDPAVTIRRDSVTFNTACINGLEDVVYIQIEINRELKRMVIRGCGENDKDALRWCIAKPDKRKSRKMSGREFSSGLYNTMGWDENCRYKILGYRIEFEGETLYIFDLTVPEIFRERPKKTKDAKVEETEQTDPVDTRKGFYPDDIAGTFGLPVEEHRKSTEVKEMDGYVSYGMITGKASDD